MFQYSNLGENIKIHKYFINCTVLYFIGVAGKGGGVEKEGEGEDICYFN